MRASASIRASPVAPLASPLPSVDALGLVALASAPVGGSTSTRAASRTASREVPGPIGRPHILAKRSVNDGVCIGAALVNRLLSTVALPLPVLRGRFLLRLAAALAAALSVAAVLFFARLWSFLLVVARPPLKLEASAVGLLVACVFPMPMCTGVFTVVCCVAGLAVWLVNPAIACARCEGRTRVRLCSYFESKNTFQFC